MILKQFKIISYLLLFISSLVFAQTNKYFIAFNNKNNNGYSISNPSAFLSSKAIQRRINQGIAIDYTDLPVTPSYVNQIESLSGVTVLHRLKWLNGVVIQTTNTVALSVIQTYSYVQSVAPLNHIIVQRPVDSLSVVSATSTAKTYSYNYGSMYDQIHQLNLECLHNAGYRGEGVIIAVIDDGFYNVHNNPVFDSLFAQGRLLGTRDFVTRDTMVFEDDNHGAQVLSTMAALSPGNMVGAAPKASYWLLRSEDVNSEYPIEEYYWIRAAEFADSAGVDIINTSLGYTTFDNTTYNHTYSMLDGKTTPIAIGARMAARKGILVVVAAGNEGNGSWYYISTPADADSVCTVGAVDNTGIVASFSGHGPTADGRIKPDVCARGVSTIISSANGFPISGNGTSFASPLIAGAMACLWQAKPNLSNMQLINLVKQNSSNAINPNNSIGFGIPDFCAALTSIKEPTNSIFVSIYPNPTNDKVFIISSEIIQSLKLYNIFGEEIQSKNNIQSKYCELFLDTFSDGVYFISLYTYSDERVTYKLIKK
ncbi:MAG: peptidase S8 [Bacteroidia bacterium]|nr:MAG: peptidase S8 [Bacteroidia bacterium]